MSFKTPFKKCLNFLRFPNKAMESSYLSKQITLDTKLFLVFGIATLVGTALNGVMTLLYNGISNRDIVFISLQFLLPLIGLIIRKKFPTISKILIMLSLPIVLAGFKSMFASYYLSTDHLPEKFFVFGNSLGLVEFALSINIRRLGLKIGLCLSLFVVKVIVIQEGYLYSSNLIGGGAAMILLLFSFIYKETLMRRDYKDIYESQEKLKKFHSLLSDDFPVGVLIMNAEFNSVLYSNLYFQQSFEEEESKVINSVLKHFEVEMDPKSLGLSKGNQESFSLSYFLENIHLHQEKTENQNILVLPATYQDINSEVTYHYEIKLRKITWDSVPSYAMIFNDVSEKQMVTALKLADKKKDHIIATVSHELRTPINGTLGLLEMIGERVTDEISQAYLKHCKACNKLLLYLVNSILDLSQLQHNALHIDKENFVLDDLLDELTALYLYQCQIKGIEFKIKKDVSVPAEIYTDRHRLIEILINLVGNAIKFTFKGSVTLEITVLDKDPRKLQFSVIDTGIGIKEEDRDKLFQNFGKIRQENTNINRQGVGLGLAIVQELVSALNDNEETEKVVLTSEIGKGSAFSFTIVWQKQVIEQVFSATKRNRRLQTQDSFVSPKEYDPTIESVTQRVQRYDFSSVASQTQFSLFSKRKLAKKKVSKSEAEVSNAAERARRLPIKNVLIVDDNPFNILAASYILEKMKFNIDKAFNGQECINLITQNTENQKFYDIILMDIQMPVMDGLEASRIITKKIKDRELRKVPIVALTAKKSTVDEQEYYESCGICAVLEKPLNESKLIDVVKFQVANHEFASLISVREDVNRDRKTSIGDLLMEV